MSTSEVRGALPSPSNQLIFPCLCYWSLLYAPLFPLSLAELIRIVNTVYIFFFPFVCSLSFYLDRQLRRLLQLLSKAIMSLPTILFVLPVIRVEDRIHCCNSKYGQSYLLLLAGCKFVSHVTKRKDWLF